jgi:hypothetical protein
MSDIRVHEEWFFELIESNHGPTIYYRVFYGTVNWRKVAGEERKSVVVVMQYGDQIEWQMPAHLLEEDIDNVLRSIERVRAKAVCR